MKKNYHKENSEIYYPKNFISLILLISFIKEKKTNVKKILFLNENDNRRDIINTFKPFLAKYFSDIIILNYKRTQNYNRASQLKVAIERSNDVKRLIKKIKLDTSKININKIYCGGDDINFAIYRIIGKIVPTIYIEHGFGMMRDSLSNVTSITFKKRLFNIFSKIAYICKILDFYPIKYEGHLSLLFSRIKTYFRFNNYLVDNIKISSKNAEQTIKELIEFIKSKKKLSIKRKNYVFLNSSYMKDPLIKEERNQLFNKIFKIINKKKDVIIIKDHPNVINKKTNFNNYLFKFLKNKKIKFFLINDRFLTNLPSELFIGLYKIKKIISDASSTPFFSQIIFKNLSCYVFYSHTAKYSIDRADISRLTKIEDKIKRAFKEINFI